MLYHKHVNKVLANNPVARAVARQKLHSTIVEAKIQLYMMAEGEPCAELMEELGTTLSVVGYAAAIDPALGEQTPESRVLRGGLSACQQLIFTDRWDPMQTVSIDKALDAAEQLNLKIKPHYLNTAWQHLNPQPKNKATPS